MALNLDASALLDTGMRLIRETPPHILLVALVAFIVGIFVLVCLLAFQLTLGGMSRPANFWLEYLALPHAIPRRSAS
jgi:hypothetical protein